MSKNTNQDGIGSPWDDLIVYRDHRDKEGMEVRVEWIPKKRQLVVTELWGGIERWRRRMSPEAVQAGVSRVMSWLPTGSWTALGASLRATSLTVIRNALDRFRADLRKYGPPKIRASKKAPHGTLLFRYDEPPKIPFKSLLGVFVSRDWLFLDEETYRPNLYIAEMRWEEEEGKWRITGDGWLRPDCSLVCWAPNSASFA